jgi:hypothetical protein
VLSFITQKHHPTMPHERRTNVASGACWQNGNAKNLTFCMYHVSHPLDLFSGMLDMFPACAGM